MAEFLVASVVVLIVAVLVLLVSVLVLLISSIRRRSRRVTDAVFP